MSNAFDWLALKTGFGKGGNGVAPTSRLPVDRPRAELVAEYEERARLLALEADAVEAIARARAARAESWRKVGTAVATFVGVLAGVASLVMSVQDHRAAHAPMPTKE